MVQSKEYEFVLTSVLGSGQSGSVYVAAERSGKLAQLMASSTAAGATPTASASASTSASDADADAHTTSAMARASRKAAKKQSEAAEAARSSPGRPCVLAQDEKCAPAAPLQVWTGALKVWSDTPSATQQFANEVQVYKHLNAAGCSSVLRMVAHSAAGEAPKWIALDGIGVAVKNLLEEDLQPLLAAITELHSHGVIHNDIRPKNVLRTAAGIKICDFGCAVLAPQASGSASSSSSDSKAKANSDAKSDAKTKTKIQTNTNAYVRAYTDGSGASLTCSDALLLARRDRVPRVVTGRDDYIALARAVFFQLKDPRLPAAVRGAPANLLDWWEAQHQKQWFLRQIDEACEANDLARFAAVVRGVLPLFEPINPARARATAAAAL
jgi:serine/threonine protein kinase